MQISTYPLRRVADRCKQTAHQSDQMVDELRNAFSDLEDLWINVTKERFYRDFQRWAMSMIDLSQLIRQIGQELDAIISRFEDLERGV